MKLITKLLLVTLTLLLVSSLVPGIEVDGFYTALIAAIVIGLLNLFVKPILVLLTLPITVLTLGLFLFVINAFLFWFAASFIEGFAVDGFLAALVGSLIVTIVSTFANRYI